MRKNLAAAQKAVSSYAGCKNLEIVSLKYQLYVLLAGSVWMCVEAHIPTSEVNNFSVQQPTLPFPSAAKSWQRERGCIDMMLAFTDDPEK